MRPRELGGVTLEGVTELAMAEALNTFMVERHGNAHNPHDGFKFRPFVSSASAVLRRYAEDARRLAERDEPTDGLTFTLTRPQAEAIAVAAALACQAFEYQRSPGDSPSPAHAAVVDFNLELVSSLGLVPAQ